MKKILIKYFSLLSVVILLGSCEKDVELTVLNPDAEVTVGLSANDFVLLKDSEDNDALTVTWAEPDLGFATEVGYKVMFDLKGGDFSGAEVFDAGSSLTMTFKVGELNKIAINLGTKPEVAADFDIKVVAILSDYKSILSDASGVTITPYISVLDLSTTWGIVGSAAQNGWDGPDMPFFKTSTPGVFVAYVTLNDGEIKIRENNSWDVNYGDNGADGTLDAGGTNITVSAGSYKVTFNSNDLTYYIENFSIGIVGSAYNDWGGAGPDFALTYDEYSDQFRGVVALKDGEFKFRMNNDWGVNYGGSNGSLESGDNIPISAGNYIVTVNLNEMTYELEQIDHIFGLVGSAYNDWGQTPDAIFERDWSKPLDNLWKLDGITLLTGEWKIRADSAWGLNYGDNGADGTLDVDGANMPVTAGKYDILVDFTALTYTITKK